MTDIIQIVVGHNIMGIISSIQKFSDDNFNDMIFGIKCMYASLNEENRMFIDKLIEKNKYMMDGKFQIYVDLIRDQ